MKLLRLMALAAFLPSVALADRPMTTSQPVDGQGQPLGTAANPLIVSGPGGSGGASAVSIVRISCTLPAYSAGGNAVCTDSAGNQTTTACAANTACQIAAQNTARKYAFASNATAGASISLGYTATVAPGNSRSLDGPSAAGGQGGFYEWASPPTNAIYAATATANAVLVFEQGQ